MSSCLQRGSSLIRFLSANDRLVLRVVYRSLLRWTRQPLVADGRFAPEPPIEPSGRVEALLERVARGGGLGFPVSAGRASVNNCPRERRTRVWI